MFSKLFSKLNFGNKPQAGFTLIEILAVIVIMLILTTIIVSSFSVFNKNQVLEKSAKHVASIIEEARGNTLYSKNDSQYGIKFETSRVIMFKGISYSESSPDNVIYDLNNLVSISNISLSGGGSEIVFDRLTGNTSKSGALTISLNNSPTSNVSVTFSRTGIVEVSR